MYGIQAFSGTGAEVVAPDGAKRYLEGEVAEQRLFERRVSLSPWVDEHTRIVQPDRYVQGEEGFTLGGVDIRVVDVGSAHSEGDLVLFVENDGVLFSGDIIFADRIPFLGTSSSAEWLGVLSEMERTEVAGTKGRFVIEDMFREVTLYPAGNLEKTVFSNPIFGGMGDFDDTFRNRLGRFVDQLNEGAKPEEIDGSGADGLAAQKVLHAAIESVETESVVKVR